MESEISEKKKTPNFNFKKSIIETFNDLKNVFVKPETADRKKFENGKTAGIFIGFSAVFYVIAQILTTIIDKIIVRSCDTYSRNSFISTCEKYKTEIDFSRLEDFQFFEILKASVTGLVIFVVVLTAIIYVMGLIFKKQPKFAKLASIVTASLAPYYVAAFVATILYYIWAPLSILVFFAGLSLMFAYIINAVSSELALSGDQKIFFHVATITVIVAVFYFIATYVFKDVLSDIRILNSLESINKLGG